MAKAHSISHAGPSVHAAIPSFARLLGSLLLAAAVIAIFALVYFFGWWSTLRILGILFGASILLLFVISWLAGPDYPPEDEFE